MGLRNCGRTPLVSPCPDKHAPKAQAIGFHLCHQLPEAASCHTGQQSSRGKPTAWKQTKQTIIIKAEDRRILQISGHPFFGIPSTFQHLVFFLPEFLQLDHLVAEFSLQNIQLSPTDEKNAHNVSQRLGPGPGPASWCCCCPRSRAVSNCVSAPRVTPPGSLLPTAGPHLQARPRFQNWLVCTTVFRACTARAG